MPKKKLYYSEHHFEKYQLSSEVKNVVKCEKVCILRSLHS